MRREGGFTLIELLVVLAIIALTLSVATLALSDSDQQQLEKDAQKLQAQLEKARALSRTSGQIWYWQATPRGYRISGGSLNAETEMGGDWQLPQTQVTPSDRPIVLGPEPVIEPTRISLSLSHKPHIHISLQTDGVAGFEIKP
jgi:general secretion pathway protein H